jgi:hypothetical protein
VVGYSGEITQQTEKSNMSSGRFVTTLLVLALAVVSVGNEVSAQITPKKGKKEPPRGEGRREIVLPRPTKKLDPPAPITKPKPLPRPGKVA